jgi:hypothetical protein
MRNGNDANERASHSRRSLISAAAAATVTGLGLPFSRAGEASADEAKPMLMFVQIAEDFKLDTATQTFRLVNVSQQTLYFADRPERIAGHIQMPVYLTEWTSKAGPDNFAKNPPNAALSVYEPGRANNTLAVVEIRNPKVEGSDLVYSYKLIRGPLPAAGGATALFIDWIGPGGGVGFGFHGVGVGVRGPGVY